MRHEPIIRYKGSVEVVTPLGFRGLGFRGVWGAKPNQGFCIKLVVAEPKDCGQGGQVCVRVWETPQGVFHGLSTRGAKRLSTVPKGVHQSDARGFILL